MWSKFMQFSWLFSKILFGKFTPWRHEFFLLSFLLGILFLLKFLFVQIITMQLDGIFSTIFI